jgi:hypothetical protein
VEVVEADDLVLPCFLKGMHDVTACHVLGQSGSRVKKRMPTDVTGTAGDEDTLSKKKNEESELRYAGGKKKSRTLRVCFSVEGM